MVDEKQRLEKQRLKSEIEFFEAITKSAKGPNKTKTRGISLTVVSTIVAILTGGFVLFLKVDEFLEQKQKAYSITYTEQMISFVDKLKENKSWESDQAILLLSSFEIDALPILLFNLENEPVNRQEVYLRSLKMIKEKKTVDKEEFIEKLIESSRDYLLSKFGKKYTNTDEQDQKKYALRNYIFILGGLSDGFEREIVDHLEWMKAKILIDSLEENAIKRLTKKINRQIELI